MNRIRKVGKVFQVLVTPHCHYHTCPNFELMLGNWTDENFRNFEVLGFDTLRDAMGEAFQHPDIDWNKLVSVNYDAFQFLSVYIKNILDKKKYIIEYDPQFVNPSDLKNIMFKRVIRLGERYTLLYEANDVISINIINPWTKNLKEISALLKSVQRLKIIKEYQSPGVIHLIGVTDMGTTYEIRLWTTLMAQWAKWVTINNYNPMKMKSVLDEIMKKQKIIDSEVIIK